MKHSKTEIIDFIKKEIILDKELQKNEEYISIIAEEIEEDLKNGKSFKLIKLEYKVKFKLEDKVFKISEQTVDENEYEGINTYGDIMVIEDIEEFRYELDDDYKDIKFADIEVWIDGKGIEFYKLGYRDIEHFSEKEAKEVLKLYPKERLMTKEDVDLIRETLEEAHKCMGDGIELTKSNINDIEVPILVRKFNLYDELEGITELKKISKNGLELVHYKTENHQKFNKGINITKQIEKNKLLKLLNGNDEIIVKEYIEENKLPIKSEDISNKEFETTGFNI